MVKPIPFNEIVTWLRITGNHRCIGMWGFSNRFWCSCPNDHQISISRDDGRVLRNINESFWNRENNVIREAIERNTPINAALPWYNRIYGPNVLAIIREFLMEDIHFVIPITDGRRLRGIGYSAIIRWIGDRKMHLYTLDYEMSFVCSVKDGLIHISCNNNGFEEVCSERDWNSVCIELRDICTHEGNLFSIITSQLLGNYVPAICRAYVKSLMIQ